MLKISAFYLDKQKSFVPKKKCDIILGLVTWGVTNRDVLLLATLRYVPLEMIKTHCMQLVSSVANSNLYCTKMTLQHIDF